MLEDVSDNEIVLEGVTCFLVYELKGDFFKYLGNEDIEDEFCKGSLDDGATDLLVLGKLEDIVLKWLVTLLVEGESCKNSGGGDITSLL